MYPQMKVELYGWVLDLRCPGKRQEVSNGDIQEKARDIVVRNFGGTEFKASDCWCARFERDYSLVTREITNMTRKITFTEADLDVHQQFFLEIEEHIHNKKTPKSRVLNMDQTMVWMEAPRRKTISPKRVKQVPVRHPPGDKEGLTMNVTIRADGSKLPAEIIFKTSAKGGKVSDMFVEKLSAAENVIISLLRKLGGMAFSISSISKPYFLCIRNS
ncbi:hypothetical protein RvY_13180 [Ramazzottius varieornatus]|uniref:HTH CENPB-type domain-containing protein n=1 Tax=Ramazzottius varieornatus TaxID=947166 RepID=A0A1D1VNW6_RAMVA|nr:hypothetical protein RvY_13180 [Ramazzottius varieornatus]